MNDIAIFCNNDIAQADITILVWFRYTVLPKYQVSFLYIRYDTRFLISLF